MTLPKGAINKSLKTSDLMKSPFVIFQAHHDDYYNMCQDSLKGIQQESILSKIFFHASNVSLIQKQIIADVFIRTNGEYLIEKQNELDLQIVMRSIFLQFAKHSPKDIKGQIKELDDLVVDEVVPGIVTELNAYFGYLDRAFGPREIMDLPINVSNAGHKTLPSVTRTFS